MSERAHQTETGVPFVVPFTRAAAQRRPAHPFIRTSYFLTASFRCAPIECSSFDWYGRSA